MNHQTSPRIGCAKNFDAKFLYVISSSDGRIKVGVSKNVKTRLQQIKAGKACDAKISGIWGPFNSHLAIESAVHSELANFRVYGEWFSCGETEAVDAVTVCLGKFSDSDTLTSAKLFESSTRSRRTFVAMKAAFRDSIYTPEQKSALVESFGEGVLTKSDSEIEQMLALDLISLKNELIASLQNQLSVALDELEYLRRGSKIH